MKKLMLAVFLAAIPLTAVAPITMELLPVVAAEDQVQCGKNLAKNADGSWRAMVKSDSGGYPVVLKSDDLRLEVIAGQKQPELVLDGKTRRFRPTAPDTADACVLSIPKFTK